MAEQPLNIQEIANREYIGPNKTGDNIDAKRVAPYVWNGSQWQRLAAPLVDTAYDDIVFGTYDSFGNPDTITFKNQGTTVRTLTLITDGSGNIAEIVRT